MFMSEFALVLRWLEMESTNSNHGRGNFKQPASNVSLPSSTINMMHKDSFHCFLLHAIGNLTLLYPNYATEY